MKLNHIIKNGMSEKEWASIFAHQKIQGERVPKPKCSPKRNLIPAFFKQQRASLFVARKSLLRVKF
jgi:hypothetical protein